ncbi:MAG: prepilin-type N-terminal cleavage/methylation domain-containing protein [Armatimonadota bacterium]|nr:prepilin-type N-terminal cleavage/methylation domain-containing protein [Armatimonadota bacterium]
MRHHTPSGRDIPRAGFTLIELLVVVAIIAILAAILFPIFAKAKEAAKRAACLGNLRQIGMAIKMYQDENNGAFPAKVFPDIADEWLFCRWVRMTIPYAKSRNIYNCPGAMRPQKAGDPPMRMAYSYNEYIYRAEQGFSSTESAIAKPKFTLLLADGRINKLVHDWNDGGFTPDAGLPPPQNIPSGMSRVKWADTENTSYPQIRHGGSNILFCDLHASYFKSGDYKAVYYGGSNRKQWPVVYPDAKPYL